MKMTPQEAQVVGKYFNLTPDEYVWLTTVPYRNTLERQLPSDPVLYRMHEVMTNI